jgi:sulfide:quinone oxidoreductase
VAVDGENKVAYFEAKHGETTERVAVEFEMIHLTPPQSAPDFIKRSPLAVPTDSLGWMEVDKYTLQHPRFPNVFGIGDVTNTPNAKTGAAIRKQNPVLVENLLSCIERKTTTLENPKQYNGYGSCPLITGYGKLILAEFDYYNNPQESFPFDQSKERYSMWLLKKEILPRLYWHAILRGRMQG